MSLHYGGDILFHRTANRRLWHIHYLPIGQGANHYCMIRQSQAFFSLVLAINGQLSLNCLEMLGDDGLFTTGTDFNANTLYEGINGQGSQVLADATSPD